MTSSFNRYRLPLLFLTILGLSGTYLYTLHPAALTPFRRLSLSNAGQEEIFTYPPDPHLGAINQLRPRRVAVIGAGASGSAAAWFIRRAGRVMEERIGVGEGTLVGEVVVFDKEGYVGGRSTTFYPKDDNRTEPVEMGASIFVEANRHMMKAAKYFNLTLEDPPFGDSGLGIWDGQQMLYTTSTTRNIFSGWWDALSAAWRYGPLSPFRTNNAVNALVKSFQQLYDHKWLLERGTVRSMEDFAESAGLGKEFTTRRGDEWAVDVVGVSQKWMAEIMEGSTRVNYATDMNKIHALGSGVSMATSGAKAIKGGNWRVFDEMLRNASATLHLGTQVKEILPYLDENGERMFQIVTNKSHTHDVDKPFDVVFFAAPWYSSPINRGINDLLDSKIPYQEYVRLHTTFFTTPIPRPDPAFFNLANTTMLPTMILTSGFTARNNSNTPPPGFQSISWHKEIYPGAGEYVVKIFSLTRINDRFIIKLLGGNKPTWVMRKEWDSYPKLRTVNRYAPVEPMKGLQYLAAMEPWISTMETQTISAREAVARVVEDWWGLGLGECKGGADAWDWTCTR